jgi:hypothetical protein
LQHQVSSFILSQQLNEIARAVSFGGSERPL